MTSQDLADHVRRTFARELDAVRDEELREKVVRTWVRAMTISGNTDLHDLPMTKGLEGPGLGVEHTVAVVKISLAIADAAAEAHGMRLDRDVIAAAALLHDVGKPLEYAPPERHEMAGPLIRHPTSGVQIAMEEGLPRAVLHIIAYHSTEGARVRRTPECQVVYQADKLSADALCRRELGMTFAERWPNA